jgi:hypothetical protein
MKQLFFTCSFLLLAGTVFSQNNIPKKDVPPEVIRSYVSQNSTGAQDSVWSKETVTVYKVRYSDSGKSYEAQYFGDGKWIRTFTEINTSDLMPAITRQVGELYPGYRIARSCIELNNDGKFYAVDLQKNKDEITVYFYTSGKFAR